MQLPEEFKKYAVEALGEERAAVLFSEIENGEDVTSVRVNPLKGISASDISYLAAGSGDASAEGSTSPAGGNAIGATDGRIAWSSLGRYLPSRPVFTLDPLFHAGGYYVQEASSMYMELVKDAIERDFAARDASADEADQEGVDAADGFFAGDIRALDLCAAPGGKTTHLASIIGKNSLLVSNEVIKSRAVVLADNVAKWGADNVVVTNNDPADFGAFEGFFDLIVVDAPCSGEGLFRKDAQAVQEWSQANVNLCAQRQQRILADIWPALKPGGYLVYSTCTYNKLENDGNLMFLKDELGAQIVTLSFFTTSSESGVISTELGGLQFVPGLVKGEGQFMSLVRKPGDDTVPGQILARKGKKGGKEKAMPQDKGCTYLPDNYLKVLHGDLVKGYRKEMYEAIRFVEENLKIVLSGIAVAEKKGMDYVPHADFALQGIVAEMVAQGKLPQGISAVEVGREDALKFLAKEPLVLQDAPTGFVLLVYKGLGLGFVKNLGNRTNNLLPMARRIRMNINQ